MYLLQSSTLVESSLPKRCLMFADDIDNCAKTRIRLQKQLDITSEFCQFTKMTMNLNKTEIIVWWSIKQL